jgi:parallel beta-helix repeat protein
LAPLIEVNHSTHTWYLGANIVLRKGATLVLHGTAIGGDTDELRLKSDHTTGTDSQVYISAEWGTIDIRNTTITSWDNAVNGPDRSSAFHRAFIQARSTRDADGVTADESRMNIANSDIGFLGFNGIESYGLSWKVDVPSADLYAKVHVYGDITNRRIHDCFRGPYIFGGMGMSFLNNEIDHNASYGLDVYSYSNFTDVEGNDLHDNVKHGLIVVRSDHVIIKNNVSHNNQLDGMILYLDVNNALVQNNRVLNNKRNGIAVTDGHGSTLRGNTIMGNVNGITLSVGSSDNFVSENTIVSNSGNGLTLYHGRTAPGAGDGRPKDNYFVSNIIQGNSGDGIRLAEADHNVFATNTLSGNSLTLLFERGVGNTLRGNQIPSDVVVSTKGSPTFASVTYMSDQPSVQVIVDDYSSVVFTDENRTVTKPRGTLKHEETTNAPAVGGELHLHSPPARHSLARGTGHPARPHVTAIPHNGIPEDEVEPSWPDGRVFVAQVDYLDHDAAESKSGENVLDGLVYGISYGGERLLSVFHVVEELFSALAERDGAGPELRALLQRLIPARTEELNDDGLVAKTGVKDIVIDNRGLVLGIAAGAAGLLAILRTIHDSRSEAPVPLSRAQCCAMKKV